MQLGHQCGMLWGAALAVGAEASRRSADNGQAIALAIMATQDVLESFIKRTKNADCLDITGCDWSSKFGMAKYIFSGRFINCFHLSEEWAPEAIQSATEGLSREQSNHHKPLISCASEVARKMGASDEEIVMVAGFAGGLGLSGNACGALGAAIWMNSLAWCKEHPGKSAFRKSNATNTIKIFTDATDHKMICHEISGQRFKTIDEHSEFIMTGGCNKLIEVLSHSG